MGMKDLNKEVTRAMPDEFQNEKGKADDEEAKITTGTQIKQKENNVASEEQQEAKESQTPFLTRERKLDSMLNVKANSDFDDSSNELDVPFRYVRIKSEENGQFVWKLQEVPVYAAVDARQIRTRLDLMSALMSGLWQSWAELRRGRGMKWRGWWPYKEEAEATHRKGRKGAVKGSPLLFQKEKGIRTFSQSSVPGRRDALPKLFSFLSFSKLASFFTSQNSMAMDLMQKYPALNLVAPFDSAADFAANTNLSLHPLSHCSSSLVNSSLFMNTQQQSSPSLRTSLSPSLLSQAVHPSSANPAASGSLSPLSLPSVTSSSSLSPSLSSAPSLSFHSPSSFVSSLHPSSFLTTEERTQFLLLALKTLDAHLKKDHKIDSESPAIQPQSIPIRTKENENSATQQTSSFSSSSSSSSSPVFASASSAATPPAIIPLALEGGKSPSTPNKLHLSSSAQIAFDPLDAVNQVKEQAQKTETNRKERPLISDALLPRSSSRHSFPVYPVPSQQHAVAKKKKAASMLSPKPQRLRREMWLGELIKEWLVYEDADQDAWNEMREAAAKENEEGFEYESYSDDEEGEEEKEKESDELTERTKEDRQDYETKKEEDDQLVEMQSSPSHFPDDNIQRRHHHRHHHHHHHHKDSTGRHHQKYICPIHSSSSSSRVMFRRRLPLTRTQTVILSQQSQAVSSTRHFVPSKKIFVVNALLFDLPSQSVSQTQQQPYSSTSSSFSPSSISPSAASSIRLMQLMQLTLGINREVTINETESHFPQKIQGARVLNSASAQPIAQSIHPIILCRDLSAPSLEDPALRFLLQGVETQTHTSLCQSGVVTRALTAPSMTNENVEMADTTEKMKRKELTPKRIGCACA
ncbi:uncharacterized protein MONOS_5867 [Monocercomonoides exilis]|uniref:uncharacterized protein n=1 Tax=Monocercomonoides exilis TaxID=2049356 RepID=UPI00355A2D71|nr:hypothetical protein MONOS_5867 [Monocercomonoides exilis]|eukprot:MONOS_5867.1-p1 / transcript=MONOS_5867.1 / gene=MONOS_5867 / organism=Monocercomonoides_exilis_PA203 / gene_product=unspecified product / transcript_product=unspecified product / location=Mono_scaffold00176:68351-71203(-) / protein_length=864 / sequence_SO=supercontig / SO=protein_coding / is_pseudo=false